MIRVSLKRGPETIPLTGPYAGCTLTLKRLISPEFHQARAAVTALIADKEQLIAALERHGLPLTINNVDYMVGIGEWLATVAMLEEGLIAWSGFVDEAGEPLPIARDDKGRWTDETRAVIETACLCEEFEHQALKHIRALSQILVLEGNVSGGARNGSSAVAPMASPPNTARAAGTSATPAPRAKGAKRAASVRKSSTPRAPTKAPPSGP